MKDLGLMHFYLGLEVWQGPNEIYLGQGKYVIEMLKRFDMMDCKPMTTPIITNLRRLRSFESSLVDPTRYRQLIGSLMYLVNTRPDILFVVNFLSQFQLSRSMSLDSSQAHSEKSARYKPLLPEI